MNKVFVAFLAGIVVGILIAPAKGSETLKKISDGINGISDELSDAASDIYEKEKSMVHETIEKAKDIAG